MGNAAYSKVVFAWSGDGKRLAASSNLAHKIKVWEAATGSRLFDLPGHPQPIRSLAWSRDSKQLASAGEEGIVKIWDMAARKEIKALSFSPPPAKFQFFQPPISDQVLAWGPDGGRLAVAEAQVLTIWNLTTGQAVKLPVSAFAIVWNRDGRRLAALAEEKMVTGGGQGSVSAGIRVSLWDPDLAVKLYLLPDAGAGVALGSVALGWSADGRRIGLGALSLMRASGAPSLGTMTIWDAGPGAANTQLTSGQLKSSRVAEPSKPQPPKRAF